MEQDKPLVYRPRFLLLRWAFALFWLGLAVDSVYGIVGRDFARNDRIDTTIAFIGFSMLGLIYAWAAAVERIQIYPDRLEYHSTGFYVTAYWANIHGVLQPWWAVKGRNWNLDRLAIRRAQIHAPLWLRLLLQIIGYNHVIAIGNFDPLWRNSGLGEVIRQYVPHLDV